MPSWKRFFNTTSVPKNYTQKSKSENSNIGYNNYSSGLKDVYTGPSNRLERYNQYDQLDRDPVVHQALNIIAEFCTLENPNYNLPFYINYMDETNSTETTVLRETLNKWVFINEFRQRMYDIFRNTLKYGDTFFLRDPETYEWLYIDPRNIEKIVVDDAKGKEPHSYFIRNMSLNLADKILTHDTENVQQNYTGFSPNNFQGRATTGTITTNQNFKNGQTFEVPAKHVIHLGLNTSGLDYLNWPFSASILEQIYKPAKQKELLENAFLIYAIQRAPERRIFYIHTGDLPAHKAMQYVERFKNELHQKRIPSRNGGQNSIVDGTYDPQCLDMNTQIPLLDGRTLSITDLSNEHNSGIQNWTYSVNPDTGEIVPGKISWAGTTRKNAEVIKLHLDNGESVTLTPDHQIPVWGKGYVQAKDIAVNEDLFIKSDDNIGTVSDKENGISVVKIEYLSERMDTGCITVDQNEELHGYHNFAIAQGVFVKNSILQDFYLPVNSEGQGPRIETLPGGENLASGIDNLQYFNNLIMRGLNIPSSYIPTSGEDSGVVYNDGKTGIAMLQEWRFAQQCKRIQTAFRNIFDYEFKLFCKKRGIVIQASDFNIEFEEPQSFAEYRQMEKDQVQLNVLQQADGIDYFAKRFILKRFAGLTDEEIALNEKLWKDENKDKIAGKVADLEINEVEELSLNTVGIKKPTAEDDVVEDDGDGTDVTG